MTPQVHIFEHSAPASGSVLGGCRPFGMGPGQWNEVTRSGPQLSYVHVSCSKSFSLPLGTMHVIPWPPTPHTTLYILDHLKPVNLPSPKLFLSGILATEMRKVTTLMVMAENLDDRRVEEREGSHSSNLP